MRNRSRRSPLSIVAVRTHKALFWLSVTFGILLFVTYLFLMNHLSMQGYMLSKESEINESLSRQLEQLEASIARNQSHEFVLKSIKQKDMIVQGIGKTYVVIPSKLTAQK